MISILAQTTNNKKGVLFVNPYIESKNCIAFADNSIGGLQSLYKVGNDYIGIRLEKGFFPIKIDKEDKAILTDFYTKEYEKINNFFKEIASKEIELIVTEDKSSILTKEIVDNSFNPYYLKTFSYQLNVLLGTSNKDFKDIEAILLEKINTDNYQLNTPVDFENHYIIPLKDII